jgi:hypothetical protein
MASMFEQRTGLAVDPKKLRNNQMKRQKGQKISQETAAEQAINMLTSRKDVSVVYLLANVEVGTELVTTYSRPRKTKKAKPSDLNITFESNITTNAMSNAKSLTSSDIMPATVKVSNTRITLKQQKAAKARDSTPVNVEEELLPLYPASHALLQ